MKVSMTVICSMSILKYFSTTGIYCICTVSMTIKACTKYRIESSGKQSSWLTVEV